jgi:hypothetical protein
MCRKFTEQKMKESHKEEDKIIISQHMHTQRYELFDYSSKNLMKVDAVFF